MEGNDKVLDLLQTFTGTSLGSDSEKWREMVSEGGNRTVFNRFLSSQDCGNMFIYQDPDSALCVGLHFPTDVQTKVLHVYKSGPEAIKTENVQEVLKIQEVKGDGAMMAAITQGEQVICPLLINPETRRMAGEVQEPQMFMERQKNQTLVVKAQMEGKTFLHQNLPNKSPDGNQDNFESCSSDMEFFHACDLMIDEWKDLVSKLLRQTSMEAILDGLKPLPSEEFNFWRDRMKNLQSIQEQLQSHRAQQVASIMRRAGSISWVTLTVLYEDVEEGVKEAEQVSLALTPLQEKLQQLEQLEYQQLGSHMAAVAEEVSQVLIRSEVYRGPWRLMVLLRKICNLFIQKSREVLRGEEVMQGLISDPGLVLSKARLVIWTLQTFREAHSEILNQNQEMTGHLDSDHAFFDVDRLLTRLHGIQELLVITLQMNQLDQVVLSGVFGGTMTDEVQEVHQDFQSHVRILSECNCDPTDPSDQSFKLLLDQFQVVVSDLETCLVSIISVASVNCCTPSHTAQLVQTFWFLLDHPLVRDQLHHQLVWLEELVLLELSEIEKLFYIQEGKSEVFRSMPSAAARLCWTRQLRLRAEDAMNSYRTVRHMCLWWAQSEEVEQRYRELLDLLQVYWDQVSSERMDQLDSDCRLILDQQLLTREQGMLGVSTSLQFQEALRESRCVSRETDLELRPHAARLFACREDVSLSYLRLDHLVLCYNQVLSGALQGELPLIQDQLQEINEHLSELQRTTWSSEGVHLLVEQQRERVLAVYSTVSEARANMAAIFQIIQGWAELQLLQCSCDSLLEGGASDESCRRLREEGAELLRLTQVNRSLYGTEDSAESWIRYLDHIDDKVQDGLFQLLITTLHFLSDNMDAQSGGGVLMAVSLRLKETGSVFEPSVDVGLSDFLKSIINDVYAVAGLPPRISVSRHGNYQVSLRQHPALQELEQEVMCHLQQVKEEAEHLRAGLDRYSFLWESDRRAVMEDFLAYGRQLRADELEAEVTPPTLRDFRREINSLHLLSRDASHLDDVITLHGWLQVDLRPFKESLLSVILVWEHLYTDYLLDWCTDSLQQVKLHGDEDEDSSPSSHLSLTETIVLLESVGVTVPEHLSAQLQG